jgi:hypothetical protein
MVVFVIGAGLRSRAQRCRVRGTVAGVASLGKLEHGRNDGEQPDDHRAGHRHRDEDELTEVHGTRMPGGADNSRVQGLCIRCELRYHGEVAGLLTEDGYGGDSLPQPSTREACP